MSPNLNPEIKTGLDAKPEVLPGEAGQGFAQEQEPLPLERNEQEPQQDASTAFQETAYAAMSAPVPTAHHQTQAIGEKPQSLIEVEKILEDHIGELYHRLPDKDKPMFRERGEQAAREIDSLLSQTKIKVRKIFQLIVTWLSLIPGINKFFIEQQAEIKTNRLLEIKDRDKHI